MDGWKKVWKRTYLAVGANLGLFSRSGVPKHGGSILLVALTLTHTVRGSSGKFSWIYLNLMNISQYPTTLTSITFLCPAGFWELFRIFLNSLKPSNVKKAATWLLRNSAVCGDVQTSSTGTVLWWSTTSSHSFSPLRMFDRPPGGELMGERTFHLLRTGSGINESISEWWTS